MSNFKTIAVVTAALRNRLTTVCEAALSGARVTTLRPETTSANLPSVGVNLFMYQVTPNTAQRNADLPTRNAAGIALRRPVAALDLHFLLSFYGDDAKFESQILLGAVAANLHAGPALNRADIEQVFSASALGQGDSQGDQTITELTDPGQAALVDPSGLADAVDLVRFTPTALSLEEMSKLWSVFLDTPYVLSAIYQAGPVMVEDIGTTPAAPALPVMLAAQLQAIPLGQPTIAQAVSAAGPGQPILAGSSLLISGAFAGGVQTTVLIDGSSALQITPPTSPGGAPQSISVPIPASVGAGTHTLQLIQQTPPGPPYGLSGASESNIVGFVLQPAVIGAPTVAADSATGEVTVTVAPPVAAAQAVRLMLNPLNAVAGVAAFALDAPSPQADGATSFTIATKGLPSGDVPAGDYLVRIEIDGVASPLAFTAPPTKGAPTGPVGFTGPKVTLP